MIENLLIDELMAFVAEAVKDFRLPVKNGEPRAPKVINGYLPPKRVGSDDDYPFVVVRFENSTADMEETQAEVSLIVGCYTEEFDGHTHCINVMSRIRLALAQMPNNTLARKFILQYPIRVENNPEQPYPYWQTDMTTTWIFRTPQAQFEC